MEEYAVPILPSRDLDETLGFYARLGFEARGSWPEHGYLIVVRGSVELHFSRESDHDPLTTAASCYVNVRDADALYRAWDEIGVATDPATGSRLVAPVDTDYGMREFALVDGSGNLLRIGSSLSSDS
ncbi:bleomycin resistance protein [Actinomadura rubrisoli]|uniref:Bleomycin resistance protein n=1 Tax=Actinomadura rubrisoli TaxID=2530368 RepID=A0A4R5C4Z8_9ACTN|nr:VOC family protein [Actinomadura rubrisoli]TDD93709.1 VOC family protein [Actinomadura rubrisoli]